MQRRGAPDAAAVGAESKSARRGAGTAAGGEGARGAFFRTCTLRTMGSWSFHTKDPAVLDRTKTPSPRKAAVPRRSCMK
eukprot:scaffold4979_cov82-Isochrysis_galbana.AAC.2